MSKNEKCTCKHTVFHCQICKFVRFLLPSSSWLLKLLIKSSPGLSTHYRRILNRCKCWNISVWCLSIFSLLSFPGSRRKKTDIEKPSSSCINSRKAILRCFCFFCVAEFRRSDPRFTKKGRPQCKDPLEGIENKQRLQTLSIDNAWSNAWSLLDLFLLKLKWLKNKNIYEDSLDNSVRPHRLEETGRGRVAQGVESSDHQLVWLACVASVSVGFPRKFQCFGSAKVGARAKKERGGGGEEKKETPIFT